MNKIPAEGKMKVLWFCNCSFSDKKSAATMTWLHTMANSLVDTGAIQLFNITEGKVKKVTRCDFQSIFQWMIPSESLKSNGLPGFKTISDIQRIVDDIKPDIIHIWGTESYWGLLTARGFIKGNIILEIQGLKFAIAKQFYSGLTFSEIFKCFGLKEILKPYASLIGLKNSFARWGKFEKEMLKSHKIISTQSDWVRVYVKNMNPLALIFKTCILLRDEFLVAEKWSVDNCIKCQIFTSFSSPVSYKGIHILLDAVAILKKKYPQIRLCIAGNLRTGPREDGYSKWLKKKIRESGISENVFWLGSLDAKGMVIQMYNANVVVVPSFVESYSVALDEALTVGVPSVASFAGAMTELAIHEKTALFFPPGDAAMCADAIEKLFANSGYSETISRNAYEERKARKNKNPAEVQMTIYKRILSHN
jgi:glycosyltransferase involved in cell wall biosynthesis